MRYKCFLLLVIVISFNLPLSAQPALKPFPQHVKYFAGTIKPNHVSQTQLDNSVETFYTQWKNRFIKNVPGKRKKTMFGLKVWAKNNAYPKGRDTVWSSCR